MFSKKNAFFYIFSIFLRLIPLRIDSKTLSSFFFSVCISDQPSQQNSIDFELYAMLITVWFFCCCISGFISVVGLTSRGQCFQTQHLLPAAASPALAVVTRFTLTAVWGLLICLFVGISFSFFFFPFRGGGDKTWEPYCFYCYLCAFWDVYFSFSL